MNFFLKTSMLLMLGFLVSCEQNLEEINHDPNVSVTVPDAQILTGAIGYLSYIVDVDLNAKSFLWSQYYTWGPGVSVGDVERFAAQPDDYDEYWQRAYANSLTDLKYLTRSKSPAYRGVAKVLQAYIFQGLVDHFGDVPFSEAISGETDEGAIFVPKYDEAAVIYNELIILIDEALADFDIAYDADIGADDLIYNGDVSKWKKFANSLKLRVLMRTSEVTNHADEIKTLISTGDFISSNADIPAVEFNGGSGNQNPMYARFSFGVGNFYIASNTTLNILKNLDDPRIGAFYRPAESGPYGNQFFGQNQGEVENEFWLIHDYLSHSSSLAYGETNPVLLMSDWEVWFLRAEAAARYNTVDDAEVAFNKAVTNNFTYLNVEGASDYIATLGYDTGTSIDIQLDMIGVQKWISMNGTQEDEAWIESRRFDRPASRLFTDGIYQTPVRSVLGEGVFPATWLYPASERSLNPNAPPQRVLTNKIFWDN